MGIRVLYSDGAAAMYCSVTQVAFGPLFLDEKGHDGIERAEAFLGWLGEQDGQRDARMFTQLQLLNLYHQWHAQEDEQWKRLEEVNDLT